MFSLVVQSIGSGSLAYSGVALFQSAGAHALSAAQAVASGSMDQLMQAAVALQMAGHEATLGAVVIQATQEMDAALLDILV